VHRGCEKLRKLEVNDKAIRPTSNNWKEGKEEDKYYRFKIIF